ncbi:MAG: M48 family metalloprotease, partial [Chlamydiota bacterium]
EKIHELAGKLGVKGQFVIMPFFHQGCASSMGILPRCSFIGVNMDYFNHASKAEQEFILAHEISHIKKHDSLTRMCTSILISLTARKALLALFPSLEHYKSKILSDVLDWRLAIKLMPISLFFISITSPVSLISEIIHKVTFPVFSRWREKCADLSAASVTSKKVILAGCNFFDKTRKTNIDYRNKPNIPFIESLRRKITISVNGDNRLDMEHPSLQTRVNYLKPLASQGFFADKKAWIFKQYSDLSVKLKTLLFAR